MILIFFYNLKDLLPICLSLVIAIDSHKAFPPDVFVCLTAVDTLCAYQAVVDYNKVGEIEIIGYFDSELIVRAVEKEIIHSTMTIDAKQVGACCVDALTEYREKLRVSNYFPVDITIINQKNIEKYLKKYGSEEIE